MKNELVLIFIFGFGIGWVISELYNCRNKHKELKQKLWVGK